MRLRQRLQNELAVRLRAHLPEAVATIWDHQSVVIAIEKLEYQSTGGARNCWAHLTQFTGVVRAELRGDGIDDLSIEALIADLVCQPLFVSGDATIPDGAISETARAVLMESRDTIRDTQVATQLRFDVAGHILRRENDPARPSLMISDAPEVGAAHADAYQTPEARP